MANIEKRVTKKGEDRYRVKVRVKGFQYKTATFHTKEDAKEWSNQIEKNRIISRNYKNIDETSQDIEQIVLRLPLALSEKVKAVAARGHRSNFIITLLEDYFNKDAKQNVKAEYKNIAKKRFVSVKHIPQLYPAFSVGAIRRLIFLHEENKFTKCFNKVGNSSKIVIDLDQFEKWIASKP